MAPPPIAAASDLPRSEEKPGCLKQSFRSAPDPSAKEPTTTMSTVAVHTSLINRIFGTESAMLVAKKWRRTLAGTVPTLNCARSRVQTATAETEALSA